MRTMMALLSAACLCANAAVAQAQSTSVPAQPASTPTTASGGKQGPKPPKRGVDLKAMEGDSEGCPRGPNGEEVCTVEVTGSGAGWSGGLGGGGWGGGDPGMCTPGKQLQATPCTADTPGGGTGPDEAERRKEEERKKCDGKYSEQLDAAKTMLTKSLDRCVEIAKNPLTYAHDMAMMPFGQDCVSKANKSWQDMYNNVQAAQQLCYRRANGG